MESARPAARSGLRCIPRRRADYLLKDSLGRVLCVLEAKREDHDPYDAKEQARGYAENLNAPFVILSNGREHWFWNYRACGSARRLSHRAAAVARRPGACSAQEPAAAAAASDARSFAPTILAAFNPDVPLRGYQIRAMDEIAQAVRRRRASASSSSRWRPARARRCSARRSSVASSLTRNAERVLFIVDRIELAKQTMEDFASSSRSSSRSIFKTARRNGELLGSSVVVATIQSLMVDRRYREEFTPFYFDLVINDEAHRSIYGDAREVVQFFQATRIGLTATPEGVPQEHQPRAA